MTEVCHYDWSLGKIVQNPLPANGHTPTPPSTTQLTLTIHGHVAGREAYVEIRATTAKALAAEVRALEGLFDPPEPPAGEHSAPRAPATPLCPYGHGELQASRK